MRVCKILILLPLQRVEFLIIIATLRGGRALGKFARAQWKLFPAKTSPQ